MLRENKMKVLLLLLFFFLCHVSSAAKHTLKYFYTATTGVPNVPEFTGILVVNGKLAVYCDSSTRTIEAKQDWMQDYFNKNPQHLDFYTGQCVAEIDYFKATIDTLKERFNQSGGVHVLQRLNGCEWDDEADKVEYGYNQYGYNGEDFISFHLETSTWVAPQPQAFITKLKWDADRPRIKYNQDYLTKIFPDWLKKYVEYAKSSLTRTELPSVSLLQKTPSSPVTCHATGFYPDRAMMFWRKDGEELHEGVEHGEILPNGDGTFQMSVSLNLSTISPEDQKRCECVFHLSGVEDDVVTRLADTEIMTNSVKSALAIGSIAAVSAVLLIGVIVTAACGVYRYRQRTAKPAKSETADEPEVSVSLTAENPERPRDEQ